MKSVKDYNEYFHNTVTEKIVYMKLNGFSNADISREFGFSREDIRQKSEILKNAYNHQLAIAENAISIRDELLTALNKNKTIDTYYGLDYKLLDLFTFSSKARNFFEANNIVYVKDILKYTYDDLLNTTGIGKICAEEIVSTLKRCGYIIPSI